MTAKSAAVTAKSAAMTVKSAAVTVKFAAVTVKFAAVAVKFAAVAVKFAAVSANFAPCATLPRMPWRIEKQANGKFAVFSTRLNDYVVIDASAEEIERVYAEKGAKVYLASARSQLAKEIAVPEDGETLIEASRQRGGPPREAPGTPIGATGFTYEDV
ncbi:MAG TPA: hypothetical protein VF618_04185 [Thermoanaerobaculia bacterium]